MKVKVNKTRKLVNWNTPNISNYEEPTSGSSDHLLHVFLAQFMLKIENSFPCIRNQDPVYLALLSLYYLIFLELFKLYDFCSTFKNNLSTFLCVIG